MLVEQGLNELPYADCNVITPANCTYNGVKYIKEVCGVSIMRSGESYSHNVHHMIPKIKNGFAYFMINLFINIKEKQWKRVSGKLII